MISADSNGNPIHTSGNFSIDRVTSLRDENFGRYSWEDSTLRIRTTVVARTDDFASLTDGGTYWTEVCHQLLSSMNGIYKFL